MQRKRTVAVIFIGVGETKRKCGIAFFSTKIQKNGCPPVAHIVFYSASNGLKEGNFYAESKY